MSKYYTLLLHNCYDKGIHYVAPGYTSMVPDVIIRKYPELPSLEEEFMDLDDRIIEKVDNVTVYGSFPVLAEEIENKMYDIITGKEVTFQPLKYQKLVYGLSYYKKTPADQVMTELLLSNLTDEDKERYADYINELDLKSKRTLAQKQAPFDAYYLVKPATIRTDILPLLTKYTDGEYIDVVTKERLIPAEKDEITSKLSFKNKEYIPVDVAKGYMFDLIDHGIDKYTANITEAKVNAIKIYNNKFKYDKPYTKTR